MDIGFAPPSGWQQIFHSQDVEETRVYLRAGFGKDLQVDPAPRQGGRIDVRTDGIELPSLFMHHVRCPTGLAIAGNHPDPHYVIILPISGRIEAGAGRSSAVYDPRRAVVISRPTVSGSSVYLAPSTTALVLKVSQLAVTRRLAALLGEPAQGVLEFAPGMDLTQGPGRSFAQHLLLIAADFKRSEAMSWTPVAVGEIDDFVISKLLLTHAHSHTETMRRTSRLIAPRDVKRAVDYMQAQLRSPITIADIAEASGIAGRTLFKHFQDFHGLSPMQYLRNARFSQVRAAPMQAEQEENVTDIATAWGFSHMGRFAVEYRRRFGESPSQSLRRGRGHP
jgi:AraC-like DNA-binding protein